jgi:glucose 1-dehydrogenase
MSARASEARLRAAYEAAAGCEPAPLKGQMSLWQFACDSTRMMRFSGKVCMVTGAGSGIGKAVAKRVMVIDLNEPHGTQTVEEITHANDEAIFFKCDVGDPAEIQAAVKTTVDKWQKVVVVVNDAAMMTFKPIVELPDDDWDKVLNVNLRSVFLICKHAVPHMPPGGAIVNSSLERR